MPYKDPDKQKQAQHKHYLRTKAQQAKTDKARREMKRDLSRSLMTPCEECGAFDVAFMDWHHREPENKLKSISEMIRSATVERLMIEIDKCICLCSNCHRRLHYY